MAPQQKSLFVIQEEGVMKGEKPKFYCRLCWQQFDELYEHGRGAYVGGTSLSTQTLGIGERISGGTCKGDIHPTDYRVLRRPKRDKPATLDFDQGDDIEVR